MGFGRDRCLIGCVQFPKNRATPARVLPTCSSNTCSSHRVTLVQAGTEENLGAPKEQRAWKSVSFSKLNVCGHLAEIFFSKAALFKIIIDIFDFDFYDDGHTLSETCSDEMRNFLAACTAVSQAPGVLTQSCLGLNVVANMPQAHSEQILAANLWYTLQTATGVMPPSFLNRAQRQAPNSTPQMKLHIFPVRKRFTSELIAD